MKSFSFNVCISERHSGLGLARFPTSCCSWRTSNGVMLLLHVIVWHMKLRFPGMGRAKFTIISWRTRDNCGRDYPVASAVVRCTPAKH
ncbi:hypothetical protein CaCOL14_009022 [Colletotrichum acutatum]